MSSTEHTMPDANRLYIGEGVTIKGEISVPDTPVVCGALEGDVTVGNLVVGETGAIKGRITVAENAEISGKVFEKLDVKCLLILRSTGRVDGNISYGLLQIEQGASIAGGLSSTDYRPEQKPPKVDLIREIRRLRSRRLPASPSRRTCRRWTRQLPQRPRPGNKPDLTKPIDGLPPPRLKAGKPLCLCNKSSCLCSKSLFHAAFRRPAAPPMHARRGVYARAP
jgi:cytoskeletal protein CcmA (bactofilin family)